MARQMAAGELKTTWFERHGSTPITEIPAEWPEDYRRLVERRIELIETDRNIGLIEQPEHLPLVRRVVLARERLRRLRHRVGRRGEQVLRLVVEASNRSPT